MTDTERHNEEQKALARRNIRLAVGLGILAVCLYVGYFVFQYMT